jgi:hypothetical protein
VTDHDYHTDDIRDFVCDSCSTGLGRFKKGDDRLENAIYYIPNDDMLGYDDTEQDIEIVKLGT